MKTRKLRKFLMLLASALLLVSVTVGATVAFLTDTSDVVTNTFTVGSVALTLDEADVDEYGVAIADADRVTENEYKLIPGHEYVKDPTVHIGATSEDGWLFVKVVNGIAAIEAKPEEGETDTTSIAAQMAAKGWTAIDATKGIYAYTSKVSKNQDVVVFEKFVIDGEAVVANYVTEENAAAKITVEAYLVQADGFESDGTTPGYLKAWADAPLTAWN